MPPPAVKRDVAIHPALAIVRAAGKSTIDHNANVVGPFDSPLVDGHGWSPVTGSVVGPADIDAVTAPRHGLLECPQLFQTGFQAVDAVMHQRADVDEATKAVFGHDGLKGMNEIQRAL